MRNYDSLGALKPAGLTGPVIDFQYDPEKIDSTKENSYSMKDIVSLPQPLVTFSQGQVQSTNFSIMLDAHSSSDKDHVADDLDDLRDLAVPRDASGSRVADPPTWSGSGGYTASQSKIGGIPPLINIVFGDRHWQGVMQKLTVTELKHGTVQSSYGSGNQRANNLCTRAKADLKFLVLMKDRMSIGF